ncbi:MAG: bifunctional [glutamate--ammonia ligase]-adenylyl-L-tyrosine phosphorylase/[glutamate--ammonia-ligase] adenylyltransferase, partial [Deltaproteobacteria bacterium]|nr:bifunctional [glutamate--ammonia ligase]-adenylyl-L-tyrosine phosphorylase/[glutamate--ammonia-ligase] adenylyltransferase [Deltaproteobacteria bacterium]
MKEHNVIELIDMDPAAAEEKLSALGVFDPDSTLKSLKRLKNRVNENILKYVFELSLTSPEATSALTNFEHALDGVNGEELQNIIQNKEQRAVLFLILGSSNYLSTQITKNKGTLKYLFIEDALHKSVTYDEHLRSLQVLIKQDDTSEKASKELRQYRHKEYLRIGARDLTKRSNTRETVGEVSALADACLERAFEFSLHKNKERYGTPYYKDLDGNKKEGHFTVLGLGKLGGRELNYSSDIDLIYICKGAEGETSGKDPSGTGKIDNHSFFKRLAELFTKLINETTEVGNVFRVDLELRPEGKSGNLVNSIQSLEIYYESWGQSWERSAMIKARAVAGSKELGEEFHKMITPFVFRRYLDFTAIEELKKMKEKIDVYQKQIKPDTVDVKLGRGGIREIEFFVQVLQIIHGGKNKDLRMRGTMEAIKKLTAAGLISKEDELVFNQSYCFLRDLEHRLQIIEARQTQALPVKDKDMARIAKMMGFSEEKGCTNRFLKRYKEITENVHSIYHSLFYESEEELKGESTKELMDLLSEDFPDEEAFKVLDKMRVFEEKEAVLTSIRAISKMKYKRISETARMAIEKLSPLIISSCIISPIPRMALNNFSKFISSTGGRTGIYSMLKENPELVRFLSKIFGSSDFLSQTLIESPEGLDLLLTEEIETPVKNKDVMSKELEKKMKGAENYEDKLNILRQYKNLETFRIGSCDLMGSINVFTITEQMTALAETCLEQALFAAREELKEKYGEPEEKGFFIVGLGKLGGGELLYGSDLDIAFIYDKEGGSTKGGKKEIVDHEYYALLAQKIISTLSVRTRNGTAYEVDARLRPSGSAGALVVSSEAFLRYHRKSSEIWERQAMTRARFVSGDKLLGERVLKEL